MAKCICEWCNREQNQSGKGYCRKHYDQLRKFGHVMDDVRGRYDDNRIVVKEGYAEVVITDSRDNIQGLAKVSIEDVDAIKGHHWSDNGNGYIKCFDGEKTLYLHRYLMGCPDGLEVDHMNHDKYDNRKDNLRIVSHAENQQNNFGKCVRFISGRELKKPYLVRIVRNGKLFFCKYYETEKEAIDAARSLKL